MVYINLGTASVVLILGTFFFITMEHWIEEGLPAQISPLIFPRFVLGITLLASAVLLVENIYKIIILRSQKNNKPDFVHVSHDSDQDEYEGSSKGFVLFIFILLVYYLTFDILGFFITTPLVMLAISWLLGGRRVVVSFSMFIAFSIVVHQACFWVLKITLPEGLLPF